MIRAIVLIRTRMSARPGETTAPASSPPGTQPATTGATPAVPRRLLVAAAAGTATGRSSSFHFHFHLHLHLPPSTFTVHLPPSTFHLPPSTFHFLAAGGTATGQQSFWSHPPSRAMQAVFHIFHSTPSNNSSHKLTQISLPRHQIDNSGGAREHRSVFVLRGHQVRAPRQNIVCPPTRWP